jgi:predicted anti-sigma-YlaC factor YlaD
MLYPPAALSRPHTSASFPHVTPSAIEPVPAALPPPEVAASIMAAARERQMRVMRWTSACVAIASFALLLAAFGLDLVDPHLRRALLPFLALSPIAALAVGGIVAVPLMWRSLSWASATHGYPAALGPVLRKLLRDAQRQQLRASQQQRDVELATRMLETTRTD